MFTDPLIVTTKEILDKARSWYATAPVLRLGGMELRDYQVEAAWNAYLHDTLVVLPTGLGKTIIAVLHAAMLVTDMQDERRPDIIVTLAPTRALLLQNQYQLQHGGTSTWRQDRPGHQVLDPCVEKVRARGGDYWWYEPEATIIGGDYDPWS